MPYPCPQTFRSSHWWVRSLPGFVTSASSKPYSVGVSRTCSPSRRHEALRQVDLERVEPQHRLGRFVGLVAAHRRAGASEQLLHAEGLRDVVVGPGVERRDLVGLRLAHREHDHRHVAERADAPDHLGAVEVGQPEVEQHEVGRLLGGAHDALLARADRGDLVAVGLEARAQRPPDLRLVVDHQHPAHARRLLRAREHSLVRRRRCDRDLEGERRHRPAGASSIQMRPPWAVTIAFAIARPSPVPGESGIDAASVERLEHPLTVVGRHARARVADAHDDAVAGRTRPRPAPRRRPASGARRSRAGSSSPGRAASRRRPPSGTSSAMSSSRARRRAAARAGRPPPRRSRRAPPRAGSGVSAPARMRARSRMLPTSRFSRSVSSRIVVSSSRSCAGSCTPLGSSRLVTPALIEASGVRKSCVTELNIAARSWFVSASSWASRARASSRARSSAAAACFEAASSSRCSCGPSGRRPAGVPRGGCRTRPGRRRAARRCRAPLA